MAAASDACDLAGDVTVRCPLRVILSILGVPRSDETSMLRLTRELFGQHDSEFRGQEWNDPV